ncbi:MAG: translation elongation factor Ts [Deltaproteobacteria bacterium]|jgi:elongation factor Ts|nr:translation elongation factor Ts [Deltaproteobacteria bacterium]
MAITSQMVKALRDKTNAGMMDCKNALTECDGDIEKAVDWLRQKGLVTARKRSGRATKEGLVLSAETPDGQKAALVELNTETDFVAKMDSFKDLTLNIANYLLQAKDVPTDVPTLLSCTCPKCGKVIGDVINEAVGTTGENMKLRRFAVFAAEGGLVHSYIHMNGRLGVLVNLKVEKNGPQAVELAHNLAMQIAATNPLAVNASDVPQAVIEREKAVYAVKAAEEVDQKIENQKKQEQSGKKGKPLDKDQMVQRIVEGQLKKFFAEATLLEQPYVKDPAKNVSKLIQEAAKDLGAITVTQFARFQLGEEIEGESSPE